MNILTHFIVRAYSHLLDLYPRRFRDEFASEMHAVFRSSILDAAQEGMFALVHVCGREFMGMPLNILKECWHEAQGGEMDMQNPSLVSWEPGSWADSFWAGLPHLLIAVTVTAIVAFGSISETVLVFLFLGGLLATIYYTWKKHWPTWSASWYGYVGVVILLFSLLPSQDWVGTANQIFVSIRFVLMLLCLATLVYWLSRRNPIEALLMAMPVIILYWFPATEFILPMIRFWLTVWLFLLSALTAMTITRLNDARKAVWLVMGTSVLIGLPIAYARTYWNNIPAEHASIPTIGEMVEVFSVRWLTSGALVLGPLLGWGLWYLGKRHGKAGRISAFITIFGMIINLVGHYSHWWTYSNQAYLTALQVPPVYRPSEASSLSMVSGGLAMMLVGAITLGILSWRQSKLLSAVLILTPLALPLVAMFTTYFGYYIVPAGFSFEFARLDNIYRYLILLLGALWLLLSGWMVTRLYNAPPHKEAV